MFAPVAGGLTKYLFYSCHERGLNSIYEFSEARIEAGI